MRTLMAFRGIRSWTALSASAVMMLVAPLGARQPGKPAPQTTMAFQAPAPPQAGAVLQLSMEQAVQMAVENNIALKAQRLNRDIAAEGVAGAQAAFKPTIGGSTGWRNAQFLPSSFTDLSSGTISQTNVNGSASVVQTLPWYGGNYSASWSSGRVTTTSLNPTFNPSLTSGVTLTFNQPLLRGFGIDSAARDAGQQPHRSSRSRISTWSCRRSPCRTPSASPTSASSPRRRSWTSPSATTTSRRSNYDNEPGAGRGRRRRAGRRDSSRRRGEEQ